MKIDAPWQKRNLVVADKKKLHISGQISIKKTDLATYKPISDQEV